MAELNPKEAEIRASGNGASLSSTSIRGLGTVVRFSTDLGIYRPSDLVPSKAVDKMVCGILPGCAELGIRDYPLIGDNKRIAHISNVLSDLQVSEDLMVDVSDPSLA